MDPKGTVLIVDDKQEMVETLKDILEDTGYIVVTAFDGYQGLELVKKSSVDIALLDIRMPGINGVETFKEIKKISPPTGVIMMTAYAAEDLVKEALQEGAYAVIYKPFDFEKVLSIIEGRLTHPLILIVDDEEAVIETLKDILINKGYKTATAKNGYEAIEKFKEKKYDVVLLDVVMPGLGGEETFLEIKKIDPKASVIMITGHTVEEALRRCLEKSAYACIYKPYHPEKIVQTIEEIMTKKRRERSS